MHVVLKCWTRLIGSAALLDACPCEDMPAGNIVIVKPHAPHTSVLCCYGAGAAPSPSTTATSQFQKGSQPLRLQWGELGSECCARVLDLQLVDQHGKQ